MRLNHPDWASCYVGGTQAHSAIFTLGNIETISGSQFSYWEIHMVQHFPIGKYALTRDKEDKSGSFKFLLRNINMVASHDLAIFLLQKKK